MELRVALTGDKRVTENLILEVRAIAQRFGLDIPSVQIVRQPKAGTPTTKSNSKRVRSPR